jgi:hypothetical protein
MYIGLLKNILYNTGTKISRSARPICFFGVKDYNIHSYLEGVGHALHERLMARRVRPDERWEAGVGAGGGKPGSSARKGRSLAVDKPYASRSFPGGKQDMAHAGGRSPAEERLREAAAILRISSRRKALYGGLFRQLY